MIRLREISVQLNIRECFFFEHESNELNESFRLRPGIYSWDSGDSWSRTSRKRQRLQIRLESLCIEKKQRSKKSVSKTPCASVIIREFF